MEESKFCRFSGKYEFAFYFCHLFDDKIKEYFFIHNCRYFEAQDFSIETCRSCLSYIPDELFRNFVRGNWTLPYKYNLLQKESDIIDPFTQKVIPLKAFLLRYILSFSPQKYSDESTDTLKDEFLNGLSQFFKVGHMDMNLVSYTLSISKFLKYFMINISFLLKKWGSGLYIFLKLSVN